MDRRPLIIAAAIAVSFVAPSSATSYVVDVSSNWQSMVQAASPGDVFTFADGTYAPTNTLLLPSNVWLYAANPLSAVLDGGGTCQVVRSVGSTNGLSGFRIVNGYATNFGAGASGFAANRYLVLTNCAVSNCHSVAPGGSAGGVYWGEVRNSTIESCSASNGVVAYGGGARACRLYGSTIFNCRSFAFGGGISSSSMWDSDVHSNAATHGGGGAFNTFQSNCVVASNVCTAAGAYGAGGIQLYGYGGAVRYNSTTTSGDGVGAGVYASSAVTALSNCVIAFNRADNANAAGGGAAGVNIRLYNCVVASNRAGKGMAGMRDGIAYNTLFQGNVVTNASPVSGGGGGGAASFYGCVFDGNSSPLYSAVSILSTVQNCTFANHTNAAPLVRYTNSKAFYNNILWNNASNAIYNTTNAGSNWTNDPEFVGATWVPNSTNVIDKADPTYVATALDFYGNPRVQGAAADIGAAESSGYVEPTSDRPPYQLLFFGE